jgi:hypothetical protein
MTTWFEEHFGWCPHGQVRGYCIHCADRANAQKDRREQRSASGLKKTNVQLKETVSRQSQALTDAHLQIRELTRALRREREREPRKGALWTRKR